MKKRTTLIIEEKLLEKAKIKAIKEKITLTELVAQALKERIK